MSWADDNAAAMWVARYEGHATRAIRRAIRAPGEPNTDANHRRRCTDAAADHMLYLVTRAGVTGTPALTYLTGLIRYAYGYRRHAPYTAGAKLSDAEAAFIRRRAAALVDEPAGLTVRNRITP